MIVLGCKYLRICHLNNCATGVATQDERLRENHFTGQPERVATLLQRIADWEQALVEPHWRTAAAWQKKQIRAHVPTARSGKGKSSNGKARGGKSDEDSEDGLEHRL